jgi:hypothetical protein
MPNDVKRAMKRLASEIDKDLDSFFNDVLKEVKKQTPIDTGKARKGWQKRSNPSVGDSTSIENVLVNNVKYVPYLDKGHSSQAPDGILAPAVEKVKRRYR